MSIYSNVCGCVVVLLCCVLCVAVLLSCSFVDLRTRTGFSALHYATFWGFIGERQHTLTLTPTPGTKTYTLNLKVIKLDASMCH